MSDSFFDLYIFSEYYEDEQEFINSPMDEYPNSAKPFTKRGTTNYIVMKLVDGEPTFRYIGYRNLTDEERASYY